MATASYERCTGWSQVHRNLKQGLHLANYPDFARGSGGTGNVCCIVGWYQGTAPAPADQALGRFIKHKADGDLTRFTIVTRNEGSGGQHSEPLGLPRVQYRHLAPGKNVYLFTERAPCAARCQGSIAQWATTFDRDIIVQYRTPYTDTDKKLLDQVMRDAEAVTARDAQAEVAAIREHFQLT